MTKIEILGPTGPGYTDSVWVTGPKFIKITIPYSDRTDAQKAGFPWHSPWHNVFDINLPGPPTFTQIVETASKNPKKKYKRNWTPLPEKSPYYRSLQGRGNKGKCRPRFK